MLNKLLNINQLLLHPCTAQQGYNFSVLGENFMKAHTKLNLQR